MWAHPKIQEGVRASIAGLDKFGPSNVHRRVHLSPYLSVHVVIPPTIPPLCRSNASDWWRGRERKKKE